MSIRPILESSPQDYRSTALIVPSLEVSPDFDLGALERLVQTLLETLYATPSGVGLAAPQIGVMIKVAVADPAFRNRGKADPFVLINPAIKRVTDETVVADEGCLSLPGFTGRVLRSQNILVSGLNMRFEPTSLPASGFLATVFQHEVDHLDGLLYVDRMDDGDSLCVVNPFAQRRAQQSLAQLCE